MSGALSLPCLMLRMAGAGVALAALGGCNTMSGVGLDLTASAQFLQGYMPPELQAGSNGPAATASAAHAAMKIPQAPVTPLGIPPLSGF